MTVKQYFSGELQFAQTHQGGIESSSIRNPLNNNMTVMAIPVTPIAVSASGVIALNDCIVTRSAHYSNRNMNSELYIPYE
jgi:hypothetical protein